MFNTTPDQLFINNIIILLTAPLSRQAMYFPYIPEIRVFNIFYVQSFFVFQIFGKVFATQNLSLCITDTENVTFPEVYN